MAEVYFAEYIRHHLDAGFAALWVQSFEQEEAVNEIGQAALEDYPLVLQWDCVQGVQQLHVEGERWRWLPLEFSDKPAQAIEQLIQLLQIGGDADGGPVPINGRPGPDQVRCVVILKNPELTLNGVRAQMLRNHLVLAEKQFKQRLIVLSDKPEPPEVLGPKTFTCLSQNLPGTEQLLRELDIVLETGQEAEDLGEGETRDGIALAAKGLTRTEARNQFSMCLIEAPHVITASRVFERKRQVIEKQGLGLEILKGTVTFDEVGGYEFAKKYLTAMINASALYRGDRELKPRGAILAGIPGTGKSLLSLALANSINPKRPAIRWNPSLTGSKYVSQGAHNQKRVLEILEQNAPLVLQCDEAEKQQQAGYSGADSASSGQAAEMQSLWLTWHEESTADVYPIFTMNQGVFDIANTRPEFLARFDRVFFVDVPTREQKDTIWQIELRRKKLIEHPEEWDALKQKGAIPDDTDWVGRDIARCCREAKLMNVPLSEVVVGTASSQARELIQRMRELAKGRFMSVDYSGFYEPEKHASRVLETMTSSRDIVRNGSTRQRRGKASLN